MSNEKNKNDSSYIRLLKDNLLSILDCSCYKYLNHNNNKKAIFELENFSKSLENKDDLKKEILKYFKHFNLEIWNYYNIKKIKLRKKWYLYHDEILKLFIILFGKNWELLKLFLPYFDEKLLLRKLNNYEYKNLKVKSNEDIMIHSFKNLDIVNSKSQFLQFSIDDFIKNNPKNLDYYKSNKVNHYNDSTKMDLIFVKNGLINDFQVEKEIEDIFNNDFEEQNQEIKLEEIIDLTFDSSENLYLNN